MAKNKVRYVCANCGAESPTWSGKCMQCQEWNTLEEQVRVEQFSTENKSRPGSTLKPVTIGKAAATDKKRLATKFSDVDGVLGGGFVSGSVNLIAGQPGIGKSTLLLQLAHALSKQCSVLYVSGEESEHQIGLRAERLGATGKKLQLATSTNANDIAATLSQNTFDIVIVDSVQTLSCNEISSSAGTVSQISNSTRILTAAAKATDTALVLVGHVTKEGSIAGPKVLEHLVDVVLQLEGDRVGGFKVLRAVKNRYGSTTEASIFEMKDTGLSPVKNPSAALLSERQATDGSIILATLEGTRPLLVEVQALVNPTNYGYPKRTASGIDLNRVNVLIAMLEKRTKLNLKEQDIFINIVGGIRISEPAADLAVCMAIATAAKGMQLKQNAVVFGEVGLSGEVRHVPLIEKRIEEAKKLGFEGTIGPKLKGGNTVRKTHTAVGTVRSALNTFLQ
ncbi:MAG: DNA repair protein RadA [Candidatus Saccharibacteria bacterium]|nr:DNA repair protein RadA [Candidatus Saccharibacteria bacterium]